MRLWVYFKEMLKMAPSWSDKRGGSIRHGSSQRPPIKHDTQYSNNAPVIIMAPGCGSDVAAHLHKHLATPLAMSLSVSSFYHLSELISPLTAPAKGTQASIYPTIRLLRILQIGPLTLSRVLQLAGDYCLANHS